MSFAITLLDVVPGGSEFRLQELVTGATTFHLVAFRPQNAPDDPWVARIIKPAEYVSERREVAGPEDVPDAGGNLITRPEVGETADTALDALAAKLLGAQPRVLKAVMDDRRAAPGGPPSRLIVPPAAAPAASPSPPHPPPARRLAPSR
ncbi:MAG: hypothetical protein R2853_06260 [Thermomicrobiales bacterium]